MASFREKLQEILQMPFGQIAQYRRIGSLELVKEQLGLVETAVTVNPKDSSDMWKHYGNNIPELLPDLSVDEFLRTTKRRVRPA